MNCAVATGSPLTSLPQAAVPGSTAVASGAFGIAVDSALSLPAVAAAAAPSLAANPIASGLPAMAVSPAGAGWLAPAPFATLATPQTGIAALQSPQPANAALSQTDQNILSSVITAAPSGEAAIPSPQASGAAETVAAPVRQGASGGSASIQNDARAALHAAGPIAGQDVPPDVRGILRGVLAAQIVTPSPAVVRGTVESRAAEPLQTLTSQAPAEAAVVSTRLPQAFTGAAVPSVRAAASEQKSSSAQDASHRLIASPADRVGAALLSPSPPESVPVRLGTSGGPGSTHNAASAALHRGLLEKVPPPGAAVPVAGLDVATVAPGILPGGLATEIVTPSPANVRGTVESRAAEPLQPPTLQVSGEPTSAEPSVVPTGLVQAFTGAAVAPARAAASAQKPPSAQDAPYGLIAPAADRMAAAVLSPSPPVRLGTSGEPASIHNAASATLHAAVPIAGQDVPQVAPAILPGVLAAQIATPSPADGRGTVESRGAEPSRAPPSRTGPDTDVPEDVAQGTVPTATASERISPVQMPLQTPTVQASAEPTSAEPPVVSTRLPQAVTGVAVAPARAVASEQKPASAQDASHALIAPAAQTAAAELEAPVAPPPALADVPAAMSAAAAAAVPPPLERANGAALPSADRQGGARAGVGAKAPLRTGRAEIASTASVLGSPRVTIDHIAGEAASVAVDPPEALAKDGGAADLPPETPATSAAAPRFEAALHPALTPDVAPGAKPIAAVAPAEPPVVARPGQIGHEIGVEIARRISVGGDELVVRLVPAELGRIEVRMSFDDRGGLRAVIAADSPVALDMLRRDSADLSRALSDAGVRSDAQSLRFQTDGGGGGSPYQQRSPWLDADPRTGRGARIDATNDTDLTPYRALRTSGRYDLLA